MTSRKRSDTSDNTPIAPSGSTLPSLSDPPIVELRPPADLGFSGTHRLYDVPANAATIATLIERGYVIVEPAVH